MEKKKTQTQLKKNQQKPGYAFIPTFLIKEKGGGSFHSVSWDQSTVRLMKDLGVQLCGNGSYDQVTVSVIPVCMSSSCTGTYHGHSIPIFHLDI